MPNFDPNVNDFHCPLSLKAIAYATFISAATLTDKGSAVYCYSVLVYKWH